MSPTTTDRARDPDTSPEELAAHETVDMWAAGNPETPAEVLAKLATDKDGMFHLVAMANPRTPALARRAAFFSVLPENPLWFNGMPWSPEMEGVTKEEWSLASQLALALWGATPDLETTVLAVLGRNCQ